MTKQKKRMRSLNHGGGLLLNSDERHKTQVLLPHKESKDKVGQKVAVLKQLVSPYGKADTLSILTETTAYIEFLLEQVRVLYAPYLKSPSAGEVQEKFCLRKRGLCLVPIRCTLRVSQSNGADIWAPVTSTHP